MTVERFLLGLGDLERQGQLPVVLSAPIEMMPHRAVGLLLKRAEELTEEETLALLRVDQIHPGLTLKWNNGPVEGHINLLKFVKRSMYRRANFDLLRFRVLLHRK
jgi:hypothetical protein